MMYNIDFAASSKIKVKLNNGVIPTSCDKCIYGFRYPGYCENPKGGICACGKAAGVKKLRPEDPVAILRAKRRARCTTQNNLNATCQKQ